MSSQEFYRIQWCCSWSSSNHITLKDGQRSSRNWKTHDCLSSQCNGLTERFNCTLKSMSRKQTATYGLQWNIYLHGLLWAYRNTPCASTSEKPSLILFKLDYHQPLEVAFPLTPTDPVSVIAQLPRKMIKML